MKIVHMIYVYDSNIQQESFDMSNMVNHIICKSHPKRCEVINKCDNSLILREQN